MTESLIAAGAGECVDCGAQRLSAAVCHECGAVEEIPRDAFAMLGIARSWTVDSAELEQRYAVLARAIREKSSAREELRERASEAAAALDAARRMLSDPFERGRYLLAAYGAADREQPIPKPGFLSDVMEIDRATARARQAGDAQRLAAVLLEAQERLASALVAAGQSFTRLERALVNEVSAAAEALAEARYWRDKVDELRSGGGS